MRALLTLAVTIALLGTFAHTASADGGSDSARQLSPSSCGEHRAPVVNVSFSILNDADSGYGGNTWAIDSIHRTIKVWQVGAGTYCAIVRDEGKFVTLAGLSPDSTGTIAAGIKGEFEGGYRTTVFSATLLTDARTHGNLGTVDYGCDVDPSCPGYLSWPTRFFSSTSGFDLAWWGWRYHAGTHGTWVDAIDVPQASAGDIR